VAKNKLLFFCAFSRSKIMGKTKSIDGILIFRFWKKNADDFDLIKLLDKNANINIINSMETCVFDKKAHALGGLQLTKQTKIHKL
jgi:hypothetical protein